MAELAGDAYAALIPLSEMVEIWGPKKVAQWASEQRHVNPEEVVAYVRQCEGRTAHAT